VFTLAIEVDLGGRAAARRNRNYARLSPEQRARIKAEITRSPEVLGYARTAWSGKLLSTHLRSRHGIRLSERQSRRLLRMFGVAPGPRRRNPFPARPSDTVTICPDTPAFNGSAPSLSPIGKTRLQGLVLRKIRRLASSGLPLHPFVLTLFDLIAEAIPAGDAARAIQIEPRSNSSWVFANLDQSKWVPIFADLAREHDPSAWPGFRPRDKLDQTRQVFALEEFTQPDYRSSAVYNDFLRPLKLEHGLLVQLAAQGQLVGYYPLYRSSAMKPFDQDDRRFLNAAAPHIAHGLQTAKLVNAMTDTPHPSAPRDTPGVVVMNREGRILGLDQQARSLFFQLGMHDGLRWSVFAEPQLRSLLAYVARTLRGIFDDRELASAETAPPAARIFSHRAGIMLKLTGHVAPAARGQNLYVVLVEQVEPEAFLRTRLMYRHGLTPREAEMLVLMRQRLSVARMARELGISVATGKTYVRNLIEKLGVPDSSALRNAC
jgi:DNA-binding CsgD family transcriptional regulator